MNNLTRNYSEKDTSAIIVGASLSGLMTGFELAQEGNLCYHLRKGQRRAAYCVWDTSK